MRATVVILTKLPGHLPVKSRLWPALGERRALDLYAEMVRDTVELAREFCPRPIVAHSPPDADPRKALPGLGDCRFLPVVGEGAGLCLEMALVAAYEGKPLLVLGGDAPDLPASRLEAAVTALRDRHAVFVPAEDGGFTCLGLRRPVPGLARGLRFGSGDALARLRAFLEAKGLQVAVLESWPDVDTPEDLVALLRRRDRIPAETSPGRRAYLVKTPFAGSREEAGAEMIRNPTTTAERERDPSTVRARVRDGYTRVAEGNSPLGGSGSEAEALARTFGYTRGQLEAAPRDANLGLGCGNPTALASLHPGDVVLDLGCGAGLDAFLASREVGPEGRVIGVDMTEAMLAKARENARRDGFANVEFRQGTMEALPVEAESVDVVVSNCAINLSPEKDRVFREAHRVLRPGGVMMVSDVVLEQTLPRPIAASLMAYLGCVGGALPRGRYLQLIWDAGFAAIDLVSELSFAHVVDPNDARVQEVVLDAGVELDPVQIRAILETIVSVSVRAVK